MKAYQTSVHYKELHRVSSAKYALRHPYQHKKYYEDNIEKLKLRAFKWRRTDKYVKWFLRSYYGIQVPPESLIEAKQLHLQVKRLLKEKDKWNQAQN